MAQVRPSFDELRAAAQAPSARHVCAFGVWGRRGERGADADALGIRAFMGGSPHPLSASATALRAEALPVVVNLLSAGRFDVELGPQLALADAAEAHRLVEGGVDGKVVLIP